MRFDVALDALQRGFLAVDKIERVAYREVRFQRLSDKENSKQQQRVWPHAARADCELSGFKCLFDHACSGRTEAARRGTSSDRRTHVRSNIPTTEAHNWDAAAPAISYRHRSSGRVTKLTASDAMSARKLARGRSRTHSPLPAVMLRLLNSIAKAKSVMTVDCPAYAGPKTSDARKPPQKVMAIAKQPTVTV